MIEDGLSMSGSLGYRANYFRFFGVLIVEILFFSMLGWILAANTTPERQDFVDVIMQLGFFAVLLSSFLISLERK